MFSLTYPHHKRVKMWTFIPLLATETAWMNRPFKTATHTLDKVLEEIKDTKRLRGQLLLNHFSGQDTIRNFSYSVDSTGVTIDFHSYHEIEAIYNTLKRSKLDSSIRKLYLNELGYFIN